MNNIIDGKAFAAQIKQKIALALKNIDIQPGLAIVQVGQDPASQIYVKAKLQQAQDLGILAQHIHFEDTVQQDSILEKIEELNQDEAVHGIIVQLPLPSHLQASIIVNTIDPAKDVDGLTVVNMGRLVAGISGLVPCTPLGCLILIKNSLQFLQGKHAVVIGRSNLVGKPMVQLLLRENCTVSIIHSKTRNPAELCSQGDIVISAAGQPKLVQDDWIKPGAVVIDVGISRDESGEVCGDVDFENVRKKAAAISPVPGGVGPMTVACLLLNTVNAMARLHNLGEDLCLS